MSDTFIGRQPVFDQNLSIYGYELLFRNQKNQSSANAIEWDHKVSQLMMNTFADIGLESLVGRHRAFIYLTRFFIQEPDRIIVAPGQAVFEFPDSLETDDTVVESLASLKRQGHTIALDSSSYEENPPLLAKVTNIVKIDISSLSEDQISQCVSRLKHENVKLLANKVETYEEFEFLKNLGIDYYRGYFFSKPTLIKGKDLDSNQLAIMRLIGKVYDPDLDVDDLGDIISSDVGLSHKILKFINSPATGLRVEVDSIQQAVILLGLDTIKNWVMLLALGSASDKPHELSKIALVRAKSCEQLALKSQQSNTDSFFTIGMFSAIEAIMDQPLDILLQDLALADNMKTALINREGIFGEALNCVLAMEHNAISEIEFNGMELDQLGEIYLDAVSWADQQQQTLAE